MPSCNDDEKFTERSVPDLTGYVAIVTGGNGGVGWQTTYHLAINGARVYIASRSKDRVDQAIYEMQRAAKGRKLDIRFLQLDLQDLKAVRASATNFTQQETRLDILINNAGIMQVPFKLTKDGFESQFQVNYLSPWIFTAALMPLLLATASQSGSRDRVRVVNVSSDITRMVGPKTMLMKDVNMSEASGMTVLLQRYSHSKQGSIRHAKELNDRYASQGVTAYSLHPGVIKTNLQGHDPSLLGTLQKVAMHITPTMSALEGSYNSLYCATSPNAPRLGQGKYWQPVGKINPRNDPWLNDLKGNAELWNWSEDVMVRMTGALDDVLLH